MIDLETQTALLMEAKHRNGFLMGLIVGSIGTLAVIAFLVVMWTL